METTKLEMLKEKALNIRLGALKGIHAASSGHPGGSLAIADILAYLYFEEMNVNPADPKTQTATDSFFPKVTQLPRSMRLLLKKDFSIKSFSARFVNSVPSFRVTPI